MTGRFYLEPYDISYLTYAKSYCNNSDVELVRLSDRHPAYIKLSLWTGQAMFNWLNDNFYNTEPELLIYTNSVNMAPVFYCMEDYLKFIPKIMIVINSEVDYPQQIRKHSPQRAMIDISAMSVADALIFHSENQIKNILGGLAEYTHPEIILSLKRKSVVLPMNGTPLPPSLKPDVSKRGDKFRILWNHRMAVEKQPEQFLTALKSLKDEGVDFEVVITSKKPSKKNLIDQIAELDDKIVHYGHADSMDDYISLMQSCHVVVSAVLSETFSGSVLEAAACGCTPIVPKSECFPEMFSDLEDKVYWLDHPANHKDITVQLLEFSRRFKDLDSNADRFHKRMLMYHKDHAGARHKVFLDTIVQKFREEMRKTRREVASTATKKMTEIIDRSGYVSKKMLMNAMGWVQMERWPTYVLRLLDLGYEVEHTDDNVYFKKAGVKIQQEQWEW